MRDAFLCVGGVADVPPIAGRSPSYMVRQMWDMQQGARNGPQAQLMKLVVANLTEDDMVAIAAYVASRPPAAGETAPAGSGGNGKSRARNPHSSALRISSMTALPRSEMPLSVIHSSGLRCAL